MTVITLDLGDGIGLPVPSPAVDPRLAGAVRLADVLVEGAALGLEPVELTTLFFQYTVGTTGLSKGAVLTHRNLVANTEQFKAFMPEAVEPSREIVPRPVPRRPSMEVFRMKSIASMCRTAVAPSR